MWNIRRSGIHPYNKRSRDLIRTGTHQASLHKRGINRENEKPKIFEDAVSGWRRILKIYPFLICILTCVLRSQTDNYRNLDRDCA